VHPVQNPPAVPDLLVGSRGILRNDVHLIHPERTPDTPRSSSALALRVTARESVTGPGSVRVTVGALVSGGVTSVVVLVPPPPPQTAGINNMKGTNFEYTPAAISPAADCC
jgi:hypothetical protein